MQMLLVPRLVPRLCWTSLPSKSQTWGFPKCSTCDFLVDLPFLSEGFLHRNPSFLPFFIGIPGLCFF